MILELVGGPKEKICCTALCQKTYYWRWEKGGRTLWGFTSSMPSLPPRPHVLKTWSSSSSGLWEWIDFSRIQKGVVVKAKSGGLIWMNKWQKASPLFCPQPFPLSPVLYFLEASNEQLCPPCAPLGCSASPSAQMEWNQVSKTLEGWPKEPTVPWMWFLTSVLSRWQRVDRYRSQGILDLIKEVYGKPINCIWNATQGLWGQGRWGAHVQGKQGALQQKIGRKGEKGLVIGRDIQQLSSLGLVRLEQQSYSDFSEPWASYCLLCILSVGVRTDSSSLRGLLRRFSWDHACKIVVQCQPTVSCLY